MFHWGGHHVHPLHSLFYLQTVEEIKAIIEEARKPHGIAMGAQVGAWMQEGV
jgi:hypothetical protein